MIDLNYKPRKEEPKEDESLGMMIVTLLPFAVLFYVVLTGAFLHGIF